jgi:DNA polymerase III epsilon subunit family exonuclease
MPEDVVTQPLLPVHANDPTPLIVLDTETTGLDYKTEKIIEIAAVRLVGTEVTDTFSMLVNPQQPIRQSSFKIHHISEEMVAEAPTMEEVLPQFLEFIGDSPYVAHNAIFDYSFINQACKTLLGKRFTNHRIDTFEMYKSVFPEEPSHGLSSMLARFGFDSHVSHRALDDAMNLARCYPRLRSLYEQRFQWQMAQLGNVPYLLERYLRLQRTVQMLSAEMADLKEIFKLYFAEGGSSVTATSGEVMFVSTKRSYEYDEKEVFRILKEADLLERTYKLNPRALEKLIDRANQLTEDQREMLLMTRHAMNESRTLTISKPTPPTPRENSSSAEEAPADAPPAETPASEEAPPQA